MQETGVPSLGGEDPLEEETATHSSMLAWEIPWTGEPSRLQSIGLQNSWTQLSTCRHTHTHTSRGAFTLMSTSNHTIAIYSFIVLLYHHSFRVAWHCLWNRWKLQWWCQWIHNPHEAYSIKYLPPGTYYCMRCEMFTFHLIILFSVVFHFLPVSVKWELNSEILEFKSKLWIY